MDIKIISVLVGVCLGWFLSQFTELVKLKVARKKKIEAIYTELRDISDWLARHMETSKHSILLAMNKKIATNIPSKIHKFLIDEYFHEVCAYLPRGARLGITDCYSQIENLNEISNQIGNLLEKPSEINNQHFIDKHTSMFCNAFETKFKIDFLMQNRDGDMQKLKANKISEQLKIKLQEIKDEAGCKSVEEICMDYYDETRT